MDKHEILIIAIMWMFAYQNLLSDPKEKKKHCLEPSVEYCLSFLPHPSKTITTNKIKALLVFICFSFMYPGSGDSDLESDFPLQNDLLPFGSVATNGIVLPSSGRSGNKNLNSNTQQHLRSHQRFHGSQH